jgi:hypothetical protein
MKETFGFKTNWLIRRIREIDQKILQEQECSNLIVTEGRNAILDIFFGSEVKEDLYVPIFETNTAAAITMTYAVPGNTECTNAYYSEVLRQQYISGAASAGSISNAASPIRYSFTGTRTIYGAGIVGGGAAPSIIGNTGGGGFLVCYTRFTTATSMVNGEALEVTITVAFA